jgi:RHS repeat-associated protein
MVNTQNQVVWQAAYSPFGEANVLVNTIANNFRFPGQYFDQETGLHYNYHRYYDPRSGRYLTPDPIGVNGGINLFSYVGNNPLKWFDPFGLDWIEYTGQFAVLYGGNVGDYSNLKKRCNATSGLPGFQETSNQNVPDAGPIPEGGYDLSLRSDPYRIARSDPNTGDLLASPQGGIEQIPASANSRLYGRVWYPGWGTWRAALTPRPGTRTYGRGSFYLHNSHKGFTHGCIETCDDMLNELLNYQNSGHPSIPVIVNYGSTSTNGGTWQP